jgi:phosphoglucosamine mutase
MLFGTDGIRGEANSFPIVPDAIIKIAMATAHHMMKKHYKNDHRFTVVIGKDTRLSGYMVENALVSGFVSMGANVILLGPLPTPAVAMLTRSLRAHLGVMISASHNLANDNGIKFFNSKGFKLSSEDEKAIEYLFGEAPVLPSAHQIGKAKRLDDAAGRYIEFAKASLPKGFCLDGLKIAVDCANGSNYRVAPQLLWELGAEVISIGDQPDGTNINDQVGATSPKRLQQKVIETDAHVGIAFDGDGDRLIIVDEKAQIMDGDQVLAFIATRWKHLDLIKGGAVVGTQVSNLGLDRYLQTIDLKLHRSFVGDRHVLEDMQKLGCNLGGEQSGHIILSDYATTGDGLIAALQVLSLMKAQNMKLSDRLFQPLPQLQKNIKIKKKIDPSILEKVIEEGRALLKNNETLLIRPSGTEPLIRIMLQGDQEESLSIMMDHIEKSLQKKIAA